MGHVGRSIVGLRLVDVQENCTTGGMPDGSDRRDGTAMEMVVRPALAGR